MIWGKAIAMFLVSAAIGQRDRGMGDEKEGMDRDDMKSKEDQRGERDEMRKEHDQVDLCMFTVDDEQCGEVDGCMVISREDYMKRKMEMFGKDMGDMKGSGMRKGSGMMKGSGMRKGSGMMKGSGRGMMKGSGKGRGGRRLMEREGEREGPRGGEREGEREGPRGSGRGPRDGSGRGPMSGRGPRDGSGRDGPREGSGRGPREGSGEKRMGNMCVSSCYMEDDLMACGDNPMCMVHMMDMMDMMEDKKDDMGKGGKDDMGKGGKDDMGKGSGKGRDDMGKGSGKGRGGKDGRRRLQRGKGPRSGSGKEGEQMGPKDDKMGGKEGEGKGPMSGRGPRDGSGKMGGKEGEGKGPMSGRGPRDGSGRGPRDGSGMGPRDGSGKGGDDKKGGDDMKKMMKYCGPKVEKLVKTGLPVTVTLYTDENCTEMLEVGGDDRRRMLEKGKGPRSGSGKMGEKEGEKMGEKEGEKMGEKKGEKMGEGKMDQKKRVRENPMQRIIPVVDDMGNPKCSFDAHADQMRGRFRKTVCAGDNVLGVSIYNDVLCSEKSEVMAPMPLMFRNKCTPLAMKDEGKGGKGDDKEGGKGRRLMEKEDMEKKGEGMMKKGEGMMESMCNDENNNTLTDLLKGLMCDEKEKNMKQEKGEEMEKPQLYVKYDWQHLMKDGEMLDDEFCYAQTPAPTMAPGGGDEKITSLSAFQAMCDAADKCKAKGCKMNKPSKEEKKQGIKEKKCGPDAKLVDGMKIKCSKAKKDEELCMKLGCKAKIDKKKKTFKKCSGSVTLGN